MFHTGLTKMRVHIENDNTLKYVLWGTSVVTSPPHRERVSADPSTDGSRREYDGNTCPHPDFNTRENPPPNSRPTNCPTRTSVVLAWGEGRPEIPEP